MARFSYPREVRVFSVTKREGRKKAWRVRWRVDGRGGEETFLHKTVAERFRADLERAHRDGEEFDQVSLLPRSMAREVTPRLHEWVAAYAAKHFPQLAPKSRSALGDDLVTLLERCVDDGRVWSREERASAREWLAGKGPLAEEVASLLDRHAPRLEELDRASLVRLRERLALRRDGRGTVAGSTLTKCWGNVKQVLNAAADEGVIGSLDWPPDRRGATRKSELAPRVAPVRAAASIDDLRAVIKAMTTRKVARSARYRAMTAVAGLAGLRPGEILGLRREDLYLPVGGGFGLIRVRRAHARSESVWMREEDGDFAQPKTPGSVRDVPIPPELVAELRAYLEHAKPVEGFVFLTESSRSIKHWPDALRTACARLGVAPLAPYDLRRMYASHLAAAGIPLAEIARRMGNSVKILLDHYLLPVDEQEEANDQRLQRFYGAGEPA